MNLRRRFGPGIQDRPWSTAQFKLRQPSLFFTMLSAYVQSRILKIASANSIHFVATSIDSSSTQTSPQEYRSQTSPDSPVSDSDDSLNTDVEMDGIAMLPEASVHERAHAAGDIDWKYGNQGKNPLKRHLE